MATTSVDQITGYGETLAYKAPCRLATTANIVLSGLQTIDGSVTVADDRVLVKNQAVASQNGIYIAASSIWQRARDFDSNRDITKGTRVAVTDGTANAGRVYAITSANPMTVGSSNITIQETLTSDFLAKANNLADLPNAATALTNLGLTANGAALVKAANYAAMRAQLDLEAGTDFYSVAGADATFYSIPAANAAFQAIDPQLSSLIRQNSQSAAYTLVLTDGGKHIYHPPADITARIWTIPANASVAFPIGTAVTFDNDFGAGAITIAITTDTLVLAGVAGSTGSRTLASGGQATALKVAATRWRIAGTGLS